MEQPQSRFEMASPMDLDSYLAALPLALEVEGRVFEDNGHLFYYWLSTRFPQFQSIDGVSLQELYEKNVLETGMTIGDFYQYCDRHRFPVPTEAMYPENEYYLFNFNKFLSSHALEQDSEYEMWALQHGINITQGATMTFMDSEGNEYQVRTDTENRGTIIQS